MKKRAFQISRYGWQPDLKGYFTLPYAYLSDNTLANDFWIIRVVQLT